MARRSKAEVNASITAAARLFATHTRDPKEIADLLNTSDRNIRRWAESELWEQTLQSLGYDGERNFRVKPKRSTDTLITAAARLFATHTRDAQEIAKLLNTQARSVRRWAKTDLWEAVLQSLGYEGDRNFTRKLTRDAVRDAPELFVKAQQVYLAAMQAGVPPHKLTRHTADAVGISRHRVTFWVKRYKWREMNKEG